MQKKQTKIRCHGKLCKSANIQIKSQYRQTLHKLLDHKYVYLRRTLALKALQKNNVSSCLCVDRLWTNPAICTEAQFYNGIYMLHAPKANNPT